MTARAFITGVAGPKLTAEERHFLREAEPWGLILFKRNVQTPAQVAGLTESFRDALGRDAPVLVDQEGGRVQRLGPPHWPAYPPGAAYGRVFDRAASAGRRAAWLGARLIAADLVFTAIDALAPATTSATLIREVIRGWIGFHGLLMSDDVSMGALSGSIAERSRAALAAGCDLVLHCNGNLEEMRAVAAAAPLLSGAAAARADAALALRRPPSAPSDVPAWRAELAELLALGSASEPKVATA